jgi:hypothetical protein
VLTALGYFGAWIDHPTAALTLSGVDMGEFVKFLPGVLDGSLSLVRQIFYLPPFALVVSIALLIGSRRLRYPWPFQVLVLALAIPVSLQLLPPAWSPTSLFTPEFRMQTLALVILWLLLAFFWLLGQMPTWLAGALSAVLCSAALSLSVWQFMMAKPAIDQVYGSTPATGWGVFACMVGLAVATTASAILAWQSRTRSGLP